MARGNRGSDDRIDEGRAIIISFSRLTIGKSEFVKKSRGGCINWLDAKIAKSKLIVRFAWQAVGCVLCSVKRHGKRDAVCESWSEKELPRNMKKKATSTRSKSPRKQATRVSGRTGSRSVTSVSTEEANSSPGGGPLKSGVSQLVQISNSSPSESSYPSTSGEYSSSNSLPSSSSFQSSSVNCKNKCNESSTKP